MGKITVPLKLIKFEDIGSHLLVDIKLFKKKCVAVVDTGASRTVFDKTLLEQNLDEVFNDDSSDLVTLFTASKMVHGIIPKFKIGKVTIKNFVATGLDFDSINEAYLSMGHPRIDAILGSDILLHGDAEISYKKLELTFTKKP